MAAEVELKLSIAESDQRRLLAHPLLRKTPRHTQELVNIYYDTPDRALYRRGIALRLRRQGRQWLQTVKCAGETGAGLSCRPEWETPYRGHFDFSAIEDDTVRCWLERPRLCRRIAPLFETRFRRTTWTHEPSDGQRVLIMLDHGWIAASGRREAISEVELELGAGDIGPIFDVADKLAERIAVVPSARSKAERGYRLADARAEAPAKAADVKLPRHLSALAAFRSIALSCMEQLQDNHAGAVGSKDPEYIHQMRVATRRLRAALRAFRPVLPEGLEQRMLPPLREFVAILGQARDYDVLLHTIVAPVVGAIPDEPRLAALAGLATERSYAAREAALAALEAPQYGRWFLLGLRCIHELRLPVDAEHPVAGLASHRLKRLRQKMLELAAAARKDVPESLHALRIGIKRLRYSLEFFASLNPKAAHHARRLADLQDRLGQLNDLTNAGALLMQCAAADPQLREAVSLVGGWHAPRYAKLLQRIERDIARLKRHRLAGEIRCT